jgi:hypothetical protein
MTTTAKDARQFPRFAVDLQVTVSIGERRLSARTRDVSRSGLCLVSREEIPLDTEIQVELVLAFATGGFSEPLGVLGRVVWCTGLFGAYQIGVMFVQVDAERSRHLDMFIGLIDGSLSPGQPLDDDEVTDKPLDPDDPFQP